MAWSLLPSGVAYFCTELSDSPSLLRILMAAASSALSTDSLAAACCCASASTSPVLQSTASQANDVLAAQSGDRASQHGFAARALAYFACNFRS